MAGFHKKEKDIETTWNTISEVPSLAKNLFWKGMTLQILNFSYWAFCIGRWIPTIQWKFVFSVSPESETSGTDLFELEHCKKCGDCVHILLFITCFLLENFPKCVVTQNLRCLFFQVLNATNHPNQNRLPPEQRLVTWGKNYSWLGSLVFPNRQQGSSWWSLLNSFFNNIVGKTQVRNKTESGPKLELY